MKQIIHLICATCGEKFTTEADYILEGVEGFVTDKNGNQLVFIDPTAEHHCDDCIRKAIEKARDST